MRPAFALFISSVDVSFPAPSWVRRCKASPPPPTLRTVQPLPAALLAPLALSSSGKYPDDPPVMPLRGTANASLSDLLAWHTEIGAAKRERDVASARLAAASAQLAAADRRHRAAWDSFVKLYSDALSDRCPAPASLKGKERVAAVGGDAEDEEDELEDEDEDERLGGMDLS